MMSREKRGHKRESLKFLTMLLVFILLISSLPIVALAEEVDKTLLTQSINAQFSDSELRTTYVLTEEQYTSDSWAAYIGSITAAIAVETNTEATQQNVDDAITSIESSKAALIFTNQADLDSAITAAYGKQQAYYTPASWASFISAKDEAYSLPDSTFAEIDSKTDAINTAMALLVSQRYTISFNSKGGSSVSSKTALYNTLITAPSSPTKAGYVFAGWYKQSACTDAWRFSNDKVMGTTTLYAKWTTAHKYTITVTTNKSTYGSVTGKGSYYNDKVTKATVTATPKAGYRFVRWVDGSTTVSTSYKYSFLVTKTRTLKAEFAKIGTPSITVASAGYNKIKISWAAVSGAKEYLIYRSTSSSGSYTLIDRTTSLSYKSTGLTTGRTYYYKVRVKCSAGVSTYGSSSSIKSAKPLLNKTTGLASDSAGYSSVKLAWTAVSGATKYKVYRATSSSGTYTKIAETDKLTYTNTGLTTGKTYYYKVRAYRLVGSTKVYGYYSSVVNEKPIPKTPTSVVASSGAKSVTVKWAAVSGTTKYQIYRATSKTGTYTKLTETDKLTYTNTGLTVGKTYYYKVRAYRLVGTTKIYGSFCTAVKAVPRTPVVPNYAIWNSSETNWRAILVGFYLTNNGTKTMRIDNEGYLYDNDSSSYDRDLQLISDSNNKDISYLNIPAGSSAWVFFRVIGNETVYDNKSTIFYSFTYDSIDYTASTSSYWGGGFWED